jgi:hypothetical protein
MTKRHARDASLFSCLQAYSPGCKLPQPIARFRKQPSKTAQQPSRAPCLWHSVTRPPGNTGTRVTPSSSICLLTKVFTACNPSRGRLAETAPLKRNASPCACCCESLQTLHHNQPSMLACGQTLDSGQASVQGANSRVRRNTAKGTPRARNAFPCIVSDAPLCKANPPPAWRRRRRSDPVKPWDAPVSSLGKSILSTSSTQHKLPLLNRLAKGGDSSHTLKRPACGRR